MRRRRFLASVGAMLGTLPVQRFAVANEIFRIAILHPNVARQPESFESFFKTMREAGFSEGQNLTVDYRTAKLDLTLLPSIANQLIATKPHLIIGFGSPTVQALQSKTNVIPIVMTNVSDPVGAGFVQSLNHPGANITGVADFNDVLGAKRLELLRDLLPNARRIAALWDDRRIQNPHVRRLRQNLVDAANSMGVAVEPIIVSDIDQIRGSIEKLNAKASIEAALIASDSLFLLKDVPDCFIDFGLPAVFSFRQSVVDGGFASVTADTSEHEQRLAAVVVRVLAGAAPATIPVEQPTRFHVTLNLKTAQRLGLQVPTTLLARADEVIE